MDPGEVSGEAFKGKLTGTGKKRISEKIPGKVWYTYIVTKQKI